MTIGHATWSRRARNTGLAVLAAGLFVSGAAIGGFAEAPHTSAAQATDASPASTTARAIGGARDSYADIVKIAAPAVVTVRTEGRARVSPTTLDDDNPLRRFFGDDFGPFGRGQPRPFRQRGLGSGVIVTSDGYILTNHHVVDSAEDIRVELTDGRTLPAKLIGSDEPSDLAVLKIEGTGLKALTLGDSDAVQVGDVVLAVGNPLGIGQTVTMGIVSAKGRSTRASQGSFEDFLQIDAPINQGNSGGALVNTSGELIGINSQILSTSGGNIGIGFAIPANMARHVMTELRTEGRVRRSQLGVRIQELNSDLAESLGLKDVRGAIVSDVDAGSPAERAGVKRNDVITAFNGEPVTDVNALRNRVAESKPGSEASLVVVRDGAEKTLTVRLGEASANARADRPGGDSDADDTALGIEVQPLTPELAARANLPRDAKGLLVGDVDPDGRAARAGIQPGDVIEEVNRQPVRDVDHLRAEVRKTADRPILLLVNRDGQGIFVTVRTS
jgi:Do/DeqQ family serine protease